MRGSSPPSARPTTSHRRKLGRHQRTSRDPTGTATHHSPTRTKTKHPSMRMCTMSNLSTPTSSQQIQPPCKSPSPKRPFPRTASGGFDQLRLIDEPPGETLPRGLTVAQQIDHIMRRRTVELVLLDGPPRLEGVTWNGKDAARADEIVAFLALNGPSTLSQVATALWPDKVRPGDPAKQMISRARKVLGTTAEGQLRISAAHRRRLRLAPIRTTLLPRRHRRRRTPKPAPSSRAFACPDSAVRGDPSWRVLLGRGPVFRQSHAAQNQRSDSSIWS